MLCIYPPILPFVVLSFTQNSFKARKEEGRPDKKTVYKYKKRIDKYKRGGMP